MSKSLASMLIFVSVFFMSCSMPDISHLPPAEQLQKIDGWIAEVENERATIGEATPWGYDATDAAIDQFSSTDSARILNELRASRAALLAENRELHAQAGAVRVSAAAVGAVGTPANSCLKNTLADGIPAYKNICSEPVTCLYNGATNTGSSFTFSHGNIGIADTIDKNRCVMGYLEQVAEIPLSEW